MAATSACSRACSCSSSAVHSRSPSSSSSNSADACARPSSPHPPSMRTRAAVASAFRHDVSACKPHANTPHHRLDQCHPHSYSTHAEEQDSPSVLAVLTKPKQHSRSTQILPSSKVRPTAEHKIHETTLFPCARVRSHLQALDARCEPQPKADLRHRVSACAIPHRERQMMKQCVGKGRTERQVLLVLVPTHELRRMHAHACRYARVILCVLCALQVPVRVDARARKCANRA
eukprot:6176140-Pleurochrysis_carterae.AAC.2